MGTKNSGKEWTNADLSKLKEFAKKNTDTDVIAKKLGRSKGAVYTKASEENISLKPKDK